MACNGGVLLVLLLVLTIVLVTITTETTTTTTEIILSLSDEVLSRHIDTHYVVWF